MPVAASWHPTLMPLRPMRPSAWLSQPPVVALRLPVCSLQQEQAAARSDLPAGGVLPGCRTPRRHAACEYLGGQVSTLGGKDQPSPAVVPQLSTTGANARPSQRGHQHLSSAHSSWTTFMHLSWAAFFDSCSSPRFLFLGPRFFLPVASPKPRCDSTNHLIEACCSRSPPDLHLSLPELASCQSPTLLLSYSSYLLSISIFIPSLQLIYPRCSVIRTSLVPRRPTSLQTTRTPSVQLGW